LNLAGAAVDLGFRAGHEAAVVRGEERHAAGGLREVGQAVHRHGRAHARAKLLFVTSAKEWFGVAPTGETIEYADHSFREVRDGRFCKMNHPIDARAVQRRLGI
jgi:hypothetical protein